MAVLIFGIKYNLFNMVVLPVIIGYGVDDGVHLIHRYLEEGAGSLRRVPQNYRLGGRNDDPHDLCRVCGSYFCPSWRFEINGKSCSNRFACRHACFLIHFAVCITMAGIEKEK